MRPVRWVTSAPTHEPTPSSTWNELLRRDDATPEAWYGVWLFSDWLELPLAETDVAAVAEVELQASWPHRQLSRVFHLIGHRTVPEAAGSAG
jgi:hypothetical protein